MRIMIVEDDELLLQVLKLLLDGEKDIEVVGAYSTAEEALASLEKDQPDILLVDLGLPGMSGIELIRKTKEKMKDIEIMVHTIYEDRDRVFSAIRAGATGYILKGASPRELIESLHNLSQGGAPMTPRIARAVIREFQDDAIKEEYLLTPREKEILVCVERGYTYKEIAAKLNISIHTVHTHIKNIYEKLHAKDRRDALMKARKKGII